MKLYLILFVFHHRTSATNVPSFIDPKSKKAPQLEKYPNVYDLNSETKVSSCKYNIKHKCIIIYRYYFKLVS